MELNDDSYGTPPGTDDEDSPLGSLIEDAPVGFELWKLEDSSDPSSFTLQYANLSANLTA
jgi:hypothetical protein